MILLFVVIALVWYFSPISYQLVFSLSLPACLLVFCFSLCLFVSLVLSFFDFIGCLLAGWHVGKSVRLFVCLSYLEPVCLFVCVSLCFCVCEYVSLCLFVCTSFLTSTRMHEPKMSKEKLLQSN